MDQPPASLMTRLRVLPEELEESASVPLKVLMTLYAPEPLMPLMLLPLAMLPVAPPRVRVSEPGRRRRRWCPAGC